MRPLSCLQSSLLSASLCLLASSALAQTTPYPQTVAEPMSTVQVTAPVKAMLIFADQAEQLAATYEMSNGWRLKVKPSSRYISAVIDNEKPIRLVQVEPDKFVSGDGKVTMRFNLGEWGDDMAMSYVPGQDLAQVITVSTRMAQR
jgi:hypothetical protein